MAHSEQQVQSISASVTALSDRGFVHQSYSASLSDINVAASTSTAISVPRGAGTRNIAAAASGDNLVTLETTSTVQATGRSVKVSKDPRAKLMFYLNCISIVFDDFYTMCKEILKENTLSNIECLLKYHDFGALTVKQCDKVLILCDILRPDLFNNKCMFGDAKMCGNLTNEFYKVEEVEKSVAIQNEIIVKGEKRHVKKIMYYDTSYLEENYFEPMRLLEHRLRVIRKGKHLDYETFTESYKVHLLLTLIFPFWVVVWVAMCFHEGDQSNMNEEQTEP